MTSAEILSIAWHVVWAIVVFLAGYRFGSERGAREENRRWRFVSTTSTKEMLNQGGRDYVVMERGEFWENWRNPLIRARSGRK